MIIMAQFVFLSEDANAIITVKNKRGGGVNLRLEGQ